PREAIDRVVAAAVTSAAEDDASVTTTEVVDELGSEFRHVVHSVAQEVGVLGREVRRASGDTRAYDWHAPVYSRQQLTAALAVRVSRPRATGQAAVHPTVVTTEEMAQRVRLAENRCNWAVPVAEPVVGLERELAVPPYALGVWLGDGHSASARFT